jgi:fatty-acyl-CoA synthase
MTGRTPPTTMWRLFRNALRHGSDRVALEADGTATTYGELATLVGAAAQRLTAVGVGPGRRVGMLTADPLGFVVHDLAVMACGAVLVPLNTSLTPDDVAGVLARVSTTAVVASPAASQRYAAASGGLPVLDDVPPRRVADLPPADNAAGSEDAAIVYFTGGTTGEPKGVVHTQAGAVATMWIHLHETGIRGDDRLLITTPLPHAAHLFVRTALLAGATTVVDPGFDASTVLDRIDDAAITWTFMVPTMIYRLLDAAAARSWRSSTLRTIQYGAAPIAGDRLREGVGRFGPVFQQLYGQTECPDFATALRKADHLRALEEPHLLGSAGTATLTTEVSVRTDGRSLPTGEVGEVCVRGPIVMRGYWDTDDTDRFDDDWLRTGDVGRLDPEGYLHLVDRLADMIITGGMNVYSAEVERVLATHPAVQDVAVIGVPHPEWGEAVHAVLVLRDDEPDDDALIAHCRTSLAPYKIPKSFSARSELPLTRYGKIDKKRVRAAFWDGHARSIH